MSKSKKTNIAHVTRVLLWSFSALIVVLLILLTVVSYKSSADTIQPNDTVTITPDSDQSFGGVGLVRLLCPNPRTLVEASGSSLTNFIATGTIETGTRATITNSSHRTYGSSLTVATGGVDKVIAQGETIRFFPGSFNATLTTDASYCDIRFVGIGNLSVKATSGQLTGLTYGEATIGTQPGVVTATTPITLETTVTKEACPETVSIAGKGEESTTTSDFSTEAKTQTGTIKTLPTYAVSVKDSLSGNSRSVIITDKNQDKKGKLDTTIKCGGAMTLKQTD